MGARQWLCRGALRHFSTGFVPRLDRLAVPLVRLERPKVASESVLWLPTVTSVSRWWLFSFSPLLRLLLSLLVPLLVPPPVRRFLAKILAPLGMM